jgi:hypothetical protein
MKLQLTIIFSAFSAIGQCQIHSLKAKIFNDVNELVEFRNCIEIDARENGCRAICYVLIDTIKLKTFIVASRETADYRKFVTDVVIIDINSFENGNFIQIGSYETRSGIKRQAFIIAIEQKQSSYKPDRSVRIFKAWKFDCINTKLRRINVKGLYRKAEGYYRN